MSTHKPEEETLDEATLQKALRILKQRAEDPSKHKALSDMIASAKISEGEALHARPVSWKPSTNAPYYNAIVGEELLPALQDLLKENGEPNFDVEKIIPRSPHVSSNTMICRINQGWQWISDHRDTEDFRYSKLRTMIVVKRTPVGVTLRWKCKMKGFIDPIEILNVTPKMKELKWKEELERFLMLAQCGDVFIKKSAYLLNEQLELVKKLVTGVEGFHIKTLNNKCVEILFNPNLDEVASRVTAEYKPSI